MSGPTAKTTENPGCSIDMVIGIFEDDMYAFFHLIICLEVSLMATQTPSTVTSPLKGVYVPLNRREVATPLVLFVKLYVMSRVSTYLLVAASWGDAGSDIFVMARPPIFNSVSRGLDELPLNREST